MDITQIIIMVLSVMAIAFIFQTLFKKKFTLTHTVLTLLGLIILQQAIYSTYMGASPILSIIPITSVGGQWLDIENARVKFNKSTGTITNAHIIKNSVTIPTEIDGITVTAIGEAAFKNCKLLKNLDIADSVTTIGKSAFENCQQLDYIKLPTQVTTIEKAMFKNCSNLKRIQVPVNVVSIGEAAFKNCSNLKTIKLPTSVVSIEDAAFKNCSDFRIDYAGTQEEWENKFTALENIEYKINYQHPL